VIHFDVSEIAVSLIGGSIDFLCPFFAKRGKERAKESAAPMNPSAIAAT